MIFVLIVIQTLIIHIRRFNNIYIIQNVSGYDQEICQQKDRFHKLTHYIKRQKTQVSMTRKCHKHRRKTNHDTVRMRHKTLTVTRQLEHNQNKATNSLFLSEIIAKLEKTHSTTLENNYQT